MDVYFGHLQNAYWFLAVPLLVLLYVFSSVRRRRRLIRLASANLIHRLTPPVRARRWGRRLILLGCWVALVLTLMDIRWGQQWREVPQRGIEVVFALDVSRSMLARDTTPTRLDRAKQLITDLLDEMSGDRVGLVVFAGNARLRVPLTSHHADFKQVLQEVGPEDLEMGGSRLGVALSEAADAFLEKTPDHKAIMVFTDGEDQASEPIKVAQEAHREAGIRVFTVGIGDPDHGSRVPTANNGAGSAYLEYQGQQVWSKMDASILRDVALKTEGAFIPAGTKQVDMESVYRDHLARMRQKDWESARFRSYAPRYPWFLGLALGLLVCESLLAPAGRIAVWRPAGVEPLVGQADHPTRHRRSGKFQSEGAGARPGDGRHPRERKR